MALPLRPVAGGLPLLVESGCRSVARDRLGDSPPNDVQPVTWLKIVGIVGPIDEPDDPLQSVQ